MATTRRRPTFASLDDAVRDAEYLLAAGYDRAGNWDLAQCCDHLAAWLTYPVAGFPKAPPPVRMMLAVVRATMGRRMLAKFLRDGMPAGRPTLPPSVAAPGGDPAAAVERLREAARRFKEHGGEYLPSPLFGKLTRDEALAVQLRHAAHHLSFLVPRDKVRPTA
jgi:hypothetical protein